MKISVKVKPNSKTKKIEKIRENEFVLWIKAPATEGKANAATIEDLSEYFDVAKSRVTIIHGHKSRSKVINIE